MFMSQVWKELLSYLYPGNLHVYYLFLGTSCFFLFSFDFCGLDFLPLLAKFLGKSSLQACFIILK